MLVAGDPGRPIADAAERAAGFYRSRGLPVLAQIVIGSAAERALRAQGWGEARPDEADCWVMTRPVETVEDAAPAVGSDQRSGEPVVLLDEALTSSWLAKKFRDGVPDGAPEVLRGGRCVFAVLVLEDGRIGGLGRAAVAAGYVGLSCLWIEEAQRRQGFGTLMVSSLIAWGGAAGASTAFLEVLDDNLGARAAYRRSGFVDRYAYRYLTRSSADAGH